MTDLEVEEFIEHFGKKGMKWGVRKHVIRSGAKAGQHIKRNSDNPKAGMSTKKKVAIAGGATALVIGAGAAAVILHQHGGVKYKDMHSNLTPAAKKVTHDEIMRTINMNATHRWNDVKAAEKAGRISPEESLRLRQTYMNLRGSEIRKLNRDFGF